MNSIQIFFSKTNSFYSRLIERFIKIFYKKETKFTHCGLLINGKIFEIDSGSLSGFKERELGINDVVINVGSVDNEKLSTLINKYSELRYDYSEIVELALDIEYYKNNFDKKYICSTFVANFLKDLGIFDKYDRKTIDPSSLYDYYINN